LRLNADASSASRGDPLAPGYYQFRAVSYRQKKGSEMRTYISATEDLKGVFVVE
jgi:hypothetical protein